MNWKKRVLLTIQCHRKWSISSDYLWHIRSAFGLHTPSLNKCASTNCSELSHRIAQQARSLHRLDYEIGQDHRRRLRVGSPGTCPNSWETLMHLSLFTIFSPNILVCPPNIFDKSTPVVRTNPVEQRPKERLNRDLPLVKSSSWSHRVVLRVWWIGEQRP